MALCGRSSRGSSLVSLLLGALTCRTYFFKYWFWYFCSKVICPWSIPVPLNPPSASKEGTCRSPRLQMRNQNWLPPFHASRRQRGPIYHQSFWTPSPVLAARSFWMPHTWGHHPEADLRGYFLCSDTAPSPETKLSKPRKNACSQLPFESWTSHFCYAF